MSIARKSGMSPFPTILTLWNIWVYVCASNYNNMVIHIKAPID